MKKEINIPFAGFYESIYSYMINDYIEQESEHQNQELNLNYKDSDIEEILSDNYNYSEARDIIVKSYIEGFADMAGIPLTFVTMESPKYYNYGTDRLFCTISELDIRKMYKASMKDKHKIFSEVIKDNFTSYDGFCSFYSNDINEWIVKPVTEYDHNELKALLETYCILTSAFNDKVEDIHSYGSDLYTHVHDQCVGNELLDCYDWINIEKQLKDLNKKESNSV